MQGTNAACASELLAMHDSMQSGQESRGYPPKASPAEVAPLAVGRLHVRMVCYEAVLATVAHDRGQLTGVG